LGAASDVPGWLLSGAQQPLDVVFLATASVKRLGAGPPTPAHTANSVREGYAPQHLVSPFTFTIGCELCELRVNRRTTDTRGAAHGGIEYLNGDHGEVLCVG